MAGVCHVRSLRFTIQLLPARLCSEACHNTTRLGARTFGYQSFDAKKRSRAPAARHAFTCAATQSFALTRNGASRLPLAVEQKRVQGLQRLSGSRTSAAELDGASVSAVEECMQSAVIECDGDSADDLVDALLSFGAASCSTQDANLGLPREQEIFVTGPELWQPSRKRQMWRKCQISAMFPASHDIAQAVQRAASSIGWEESPKFSIVKNENQDWIKSFQESFSPVQVSEDLWVVPPWCEQPVDMSPSALSLFLEPGLSFGTGEHPTTRLSLRWLQGKDRVNGRSEQGTVQGTADEKGASRVRPGSSILDYGTGSGILAVAAIKLGASCAVGIDIDPLCISSAKHNAQLNGVIAGETAEEASPGEPYFQVVIATEEDPDPAARIRLPQLLDSTASRQQRESGSCVDEGEQQPQFDIVVANILVNPLVELSGRIVGYARPGGRVGLSGVLVSQVDQVMEAYEPLLEDIKVVEDEGWAIVHGIRR